jgi:uncharacterized protein YndB with AHSA1/START domain
MTDNNDAQAEQQPPKPNPALKSLDRLVGTWNVSGPDIKGQVRFEWMEGGFFLMQHVDLEHDGHRIKGMEIIGYEREFGTTEPSKDIKSHWFGNTGDTFVYYDQNQINPSETGNLIMNETFVAKATIAINAPASRVWDALTKPDLIRQYLFGTKVTTDWRAGSPITYEGTWEGKAYKDKGQVLQVEPGKLLISTFWSSLSGLPDVPESYQAVRYELATEAGGTKLTVTQDNNATQEDANHSEQNWKIVLDGIKKLLED